MIDDDLTDRFPPAPRWFVVVCLSVLLILFGWQLASWYFALLAAWVFVCAVVLTYLKGGSK